MEAPRREVPERTLASGGDLQGREIGLTQDNFNRMFRETLLVGVMDGKITEERAMILAGENEDLRAKLQEAFKTIKSPRDPPLQNQVLPLLNVHPRCSTCSRSSCRIKKI